MKKKLNCILLIDDDEATNFLHKIVIEDADCCEHVVCASDGQKALDFLSTPVNGVYPSPELIFLDVNMPRVNGWEFLEAYRDLSEDQKGEVIIVMLTTSLNPYDKERANKIKEISSFENKPLAVDMIEKIIAKYLNKQSVV